MKTDTGTWMNIDRRRNERRARPAAARYGVLLTVLCVLPLMTGCQKKSACERNGVVVEINGNHGHEVTIPTDHVKRGVGGMYPLRGGTHEHTMNLTDAEMATLQQGTPVTTRTTSVQSHVHEITVRCKE